MRPCQGRDRGFESRRDRTNHFVKNLEAKISSRFYLLNTYTIVMILNKSLVLILRYMVVYGIDPRNPVRIQLPRRLEYQIQHNS